MVHSRLQWLRMDSENRKIGSCLTEGQPKPCRGPMPWWSRRACLDRQSLPLRSAPRDRENHPLGAPISHARKVKVRAGRTKNRVTVVIGIEDAENTTSTSGIRGRCISALLQLWYAYVVRKKSDGKKGAHLEISLGLLKNNPRGVSHP